MVVPGTSASCPAPRAAAPSPPDPRGRQRLRPLALLRSVLTGRRGPAFVALRLQVLPHLLVTQNRPQTPSPCPRLFTCCPLAAGESAPWPASPSVRPPAGLAPSRAHRGAAQRLPALQQDLAAQSLHPRGCPGLGRLNRRPGEARAAPEGRVRSWALRNGRGCGTREASRQKGLTSVEDVCTPARWPALCGQATAAQPSPAAGTRVRPHLTDRSPQSGGGLPPGAEPTFSLGPKVTREAERVFRFLEAFPRRFFQKAHSRGARFQALCAWASEPLARRPGSGRRRWGPRAPLNHQVYVGIGPQIHRTVWPHSPHQVCLFIGGHFSRTFQDLRSTYPGLTDSQLGLPEPRRHAGIVRGAGCLPVARGPQTLCGQMWLRASARPWPVLGGWEGGSRTGEEGLLQVTPPSEEPAQTKARSGPFIHPTDQVLSNGGQPGPPACCWTWGRRVR